MTCVAALFLTWVAGSSATARPELTGPLPDLARQLASLGRYDAGAVEYLRHGFQRPADLAPAMERAALCLQRGGRSTDARRLMEQALARFGGRDGFLVFRLGSACLADSAPLPPACAPADDAQRSVWTADPMLRRVLYLPVMAALGQARWTEGERLLAGHGADGDDAVLAAWSREDREFAARGLALPRKSPWVAGTLSAVIPGLGKGYLGRWPDGLISFTTGAATVAVAVLGFRDDGVRSTKGWALGALGAVFYGGNVYGSAVGARVANREVRDRLGGEIGSAYEGRLDPP